MLSKTTVSEGKPRKALADLSSNKMLLLGQHIDSQKVEAIIALEAIATARRPRMRKLSSVIGARVIKSPGRVKCPELRKMRQKVALHADTAQCPPPCEVATNEGTQSPHDDTSSHVTPSEQPGHDDRVQNDNVKHAQQVSESDHFRLHSPHGAPDGTSTSVELGARSAPIKIPSRNIFRKAISEPAKSTAHLQQPKRTWSSTERVLQVKPAGVTKNRLNPIPRSPISGASTLLFGRSCEERNPEGRRWSIASPLRRYFSDARVGSSISLLQSMPQAALSLENIATAHKYISAQDKLDVARYELDGAIKCAMELEKRIRQVMESVEQRRCYDNLLYGKSARYVEWVVRRNHLNHALLLLRDDVDDFRDNVDACWDELIKSGEALFDIFEPSYFQFFERKGRSLTEQSYDSPFPLALIETAEARCEEQEKLDLEEMESLAKLPFQDGREFLVGRHVLADHCVEHLRELTAFRVESTRRLDLLKQQKEQVAAGGSVSDRELKSFGFDHAINKCKAQLQAVERDVQSLVSKGRELGLAISPDGMILYNPYQKKAQEHSYEEDDYMEEGDDGEYDNCEYDTGEKGDAEMDCEQAFGSEEDREMQQIGQERIVSWRKQVEYSVSEQRTPGPVTLGCDESLGTLEEDASRDGAEDSWQVDLADMGMEDSVSANEPDYKIDLGYCFWGKCIAVEEKRRERRREQFEASLFQKDQFSRGGGADGETLEI